MTVVLFSVLMAAAGLMAPAAQQPTGATPVGPETFQVTATVKGTGAVTGTVTVAMTLRIDRYTPEHAKVAMTDALKYRGYPGFLLALRDSPIAGSLEIGERKFVVRWANQEPAGAGRTITIVTDTPVFFFGSRRPDPKPTKGYEVAVMKLDVDAAGRGSGVMAAAARVKPTGTGGVQIDQYAETPLTLTVVPAAAK